MGIKMIWAEDLEGTIGNGKKLPWSIKEEMAYFKRKTTGHTVVMGLNTFASLKYKPLPNRENIVLVLPKDFEKISEKYTDVTVYDDFTKVIEMSQEQDVFVIGGKTIYELFMPYADTIYRTKIQKAFKGDVKMDPIDRTQFVLTNFKVETTSEDIDLKFETFKRIDFV